MPVYDLPPELAAIAERGIITSNDVLRLKQSIFSDGAVSVAEADALFRIHQICSLGDSSWNGFFVDTLTDYIVFQDEPKGYITLDNAIWLIERISDGGGVKTAIELELLVNVLEKSRWSPPRLACFALEQIKHGVLNGKGPLRDELALEPGIIGEAEVDLLRRILYAFGGDGNIAITREEAEVLFDINDATSEAQNHATWSDLFVKAIANHVMTGSGYQGPSREEALKRSAWLDERQGISGFLNQMVSGGFKSVIEAYKQQSSEEAALARLEAQRLELITGERVTAQEAGWLKDRIGREDKLHENELALLRFLKTESPDIHPSLKPLLELAA